MELQWKQEEYPHLRSDLRQVLNLEQTQELRLPEGMPDIGRVLCAWAQPLVQGKQWHNDSISVSGGINASVLYAPEDGSEPRSAEVWLPFTGKWPLADSMREGVIQTCCRLKSVDARALSGRKLMVRASIGLLAEAMELTQTTVYQPDQVPQDVYLQENTYPVMLPCEAGEKVFTVEEVLPMDPIPRKILSCDVQPVITEQTAAGSKVILRGQCRVHLVYLGEDDQINSVWYAFPFAQLAELDRDYDKEAAATVMLAVSDLQIALEQQVSVRCTLVGQYVVYARQLLVIAQDAYSTGHALDKNMEILRIPAMLEHITQPMQLSAQKDLAASQVVDVAFFPEFPAQYREADTVVLEVPGLFQILYRDADGQLRVLHQSVMERLELPADGHCNISVSVHCPAEVEHMLYADRLRLDCTVELDILTTADQELPMVTGLMLGEAISLDPNRPTLILQRPGLLSLWDLAKTCGSTVDAIRQANGLTDEPQHDRILLIPVM